MSSACVQLKLSFERFYKSATPADSATFVANLRAKSGSKVTMSQLQEHFVQHRTSTMAQAMADIRLGQQISDTREYGDSQSFYS